MVHVATPLTLLLFSTTAFAALQGADCAARGDKMSASARVSFMKSCLRDASKPENIKEVERKHKSALCEQNAKGMKLRGSDKANYEANCMNSNEAAIAASAKRYDTIPREYNPPAKDIATKGATQNSTAKPQKNPRAKKKGK